MLLLKQSSASVLVSGNPTPFLHTSRFTCRVGSLPLSKTYSPQSFTLKKLPTSSSGRLTPVLACSSHETSPISENTPVHVVSEIIVGVLGGGQLGLYYVELHLNALRDIFHVVLVAEVRVAIQEQRRLLARQETYHRFEKADILISESSVRRRVRVHCGSHVYSCRHLDPDTCSRNHAGFRMAHRLITRALSVPGASVHWYDKPEMRKQRKMGHITLVGQSMGVLERRLQCTLSEQGHQQYMTPRVGIIMASDSDLPVMKDAAKILDMFGDTREVRIVSAHRTPEMMFSYATAAHSRGVQVIIAGAGGAAHIPGLLTKTPRGVPVATVGINNSTNAALLAIRMLGISDSDLVSRMSQYQEDMREENMVKGEKLKQEGWESYLNH